MLQIYNKLLELPLFIGISNAELADIVGNTKFGFHKLSEGKILVKEDEKCEQLYFLVSGSLRVLSRADNHRYSIEEQLKAPAVIQPEHFFGLIQHHTKTFSAATACSLLSLDKTEVLRLMDESFIFRLNFLNTVSMQAQKGSHYPWRQQPTDIRDQFISFFVSAVLTQAGPKVLDASKWRILDMTASKSDNVSHMLNAMEAESQLTISRGIITIPLLENLG